MKGVGPTMARTKRVFVDSGELRAVAEQLVTRYRDMLAHVRLDQVYFAFCVSERAKNSRAAVIRTAVSNPLPGMVTSKPYQIAVYKDDWEEWTPAKRHATILESLCYIDEDGKYRKPDVQELYAFAALWGPDWRDDPTIPDILEEAVDFPTKPEANEDDGDGPKKQKKDSVLMDIEDEEKSRDRALQARQARLDASGTGDDNHEDDEGSDASSMDF